MMNQFYTRVLLLAASALWSVMLLPWALAAFLTAFLAGSSSLPPALFGLTAFTTYSLPLTLGGASILAWILHAVRRHAIAVVAVLSPGLHVGAIILVWTFINLYI